MMCAAVVTAGFVAVDADVVLWSVIRQDRAVKQTPLAKLWYFKVSRQKQEWPEVKFSLVCSSLETVSATFSVSQLVLGVNKLFLSE